MTRTVLLLLGLGTLTACGQYQGLTANCFDNNNSPAVTRSANSLNFLAETSGRLSTSAAPVDDCTFTPLGGPEVE